MNYSRHRGLQYAGSKGKCCRGIVKIINSLLKPGDLFYDPFCGSGKIIQGIRSDVRRVGADIDPQIICLLKAVRDGWKPPRAVTEDEYRVWMGRRKTHVHPMMAFLGYGCSFGGRYFQGYARSKKGTVNFARHAANALERQRPFLQGCKFFCRDYRDAPNLAHVTYLDPPYAGTKPVGSETTTFNTMKFWQWVKEWARVTTVLVSEYTCPIPGARVVWEKNVAASIRCGTGGDGGAKGNGSRKREKLFLFGPTTKVGLL